MTTTVQGVLFGMKPYKMLVLPICMAKQVKFVEFRPNEAFSSICVFFYISMSNFKKNMSSSTLWESDRSSSNAP